MSQTKWPKKRRKKTLESLAPAQDSFDDLARDAQFRVQMVIRADMHLFESRCFLLQHGQLETRRRKRRRRWQSEKQRVD